MRSTEQTCDKMAVNVVGKSLCSLYCVESVMRIIELILANNLKLLKHGMTLLENFPKTY